MNVTTKTEKRVRFIPVTPYARRFWMNDDPKTYSGNPDGQGSTRLSPDEDGFVQDGFAMSNYLGWVEERTVYVIEPEPWEVL